MAGKVLGAMALAAQLAKTKKGRAYVMEKIKEKYTDFTNSQAGKIVDKAFQSLKFNKEGKPFGQFYKDMAKYQQAFKESAKEGAKRGALLAGPPSAIAGGAFVAYKDDIDKLIASIGDTTSGTASAKSASSGSSASSQGGRGDGKAEVKARREAQSPPKSVAEAKRRGMDYYIGADGKKKKAVYAEEVKPKAKPKPKAPAKKKSNVLSETDASTAISYNRGGMGTKKYANCGASMKPNRMSRS